MISNQNLLRRLTLSIIIALVLIILFLFVKHYPPFSLPALQMASFLETSNDLIVIPRIPFASDFDGDGINDLDDILAGARLDAANRPTYRSAYYRGGYPPDDEGVCTDVIWRALLNAGYVLKDMLDQDILQHIHDYPRVDGNPDPNIDFRRVLNLIPFFKRHAAALTTEVIPYDMENLKEWQGGDIVIFGGPTYHIAIVSDRRRADGVPLIIHNAAPYTMENDMLLYWHENISEIIHHCRFPKLP